MYFRGDKRLIHNRRNDDSGGYGLGVVLLLATTHVKLGRATIQEDRCVGTLQRVSEQGM
jgi:hypothetical protein